eukprot:4116579-Amphidinium_carterae.1
MTAHSGPVSCGKRGRHHDTSSESEQGAPKLLRGARKWGEAVVQTKLWQILGRSAKDDYIACVIVLESGW